MRSLTFFPLVLSNKTYFISGGVTDRGREPNRKFYYSFVLRLSVILISSEANRHCLLESVAGLSLAWHHMLCIKRIAVFLRCILQHECNRTQDTNFTLDLTGIHISSRQVVRDDYKALRTSIKDYKLVWQTRKF